MKPLTRSIATFAAVGLTLLTTLPAWSACPELRIDAPTQEARVTQLTAQLLEQAQFAHHRFDDELAAKFLNRYLDVLDGSHELFFQSDVAEFGNFLPQLATATVRDGDTHPAHLIFDRSLQRIAERSAFVAKSLAEEKFDFSGKDSFSFDREKAVRPRDVTEAREVWHQRLRAEVLQEKLACKTPEKITEILTRRYARQEQTMKKLSSGAVLEMYLDALAHVYDPHSDYMGREQLQSFKIGMNLSLVGVGATLQSDDGYCKVRELVPGGPAARGGKLKVGDRIVGVSQGQSKDPTDLLDLPLPQIVDLIRGPKGSEVTLTVIPAGNPESVRKTFTIQRDEIRLEDQRAKARIVDFPADGGKTVRLGVIELPGFYAGENGHGASATADVARLAKKLEQEGVHGLILDLRHNGGGSLEEAINLTGLFIPSGAVVQTRDLAGHVEVGEDRDGKTLYGGPLIVLTSRFSASASEIVAGALQDYGRAIVVGDTSTFGKGTVQTMLPLGSIMERAGVLPEGDPGALKVTISKFYRPSGNSTQLRGVRADIVLPSLSDNPEISESGMKDPLPWDSVPPARYPHYDLVVPYVSKLRDESHARIATDKDFGWLRKDLEFAEKNRATKTLSLNEAERKHEKDEITARTRARTAEILARKEPAPVTYEITVKNAGASGLPAAVDSKKTAAPAFATNDEDGDAAPTLPAQDILLGEAEHILSDYVGLLEHSAGPVLSEHKVGVR
jgi:carboxyl-terminal processing protease